MSELLNQYLVVQPEDLINSPSAIYHEHSKSSEFRVRFADRDPRRTESMLQLYHRLNEHTRSFDHLRRTPLVPANWGAISAPLGNVLQNRRTTREFSGASISIDKLSQLLTVSTGVTGQVEYQPGHTRNLRAYPSGGALYPLDIYAAVFDVQTLPAGVYFFDPDRTSLSQLKHGDSRDEFYAAFIDEPMIRTAAVALIFVAVFKRSKIKYEERAYRFVLLEAGHAAQNCVLVGQALDLQVVPTGAFFDRQLERLLELDGVEESVVHAVIVGQKRVDRV